MSHVEDLLNGESTENLQGVFILLQEAYKTTQPVDENYPWYKYILEAILEELRKRHDPLLKALVVAHFEDTKASD